MTKNFLIDVPGVIDRPRYPNVEYVTWESGRKLKEHLAVCASYFKQEIGTDCLQYDEDMFRRKDLEGFLLLQPARDLCKHIEQHPCRIVGGGVFANHEGQYELDWVWLHPFARNRGLLGNCWEEFQTKFGQFSVAEPLSAQMEAFLSKRPVKS